MNTLKYLAVGLAVIAAASCQDGIAPEQGNETEVIINATIDNVETKTEFGEKDRNRQPVLWEDKDNIMVFDGGCYTQRFRTDKGGQTAKFQFYAGWTGENPWTEADKYYAVYMGDPDHRNGYSLTRNEDGTATMTLPSIPNVQDPTPGYNKVLSYIYGVGTQTSVNNEKTYIDMYFSNLTALIKFELQGNDITGVRFLDQSGAVLSGGNYSVQFAADGNVSATMNSGTKKQLYMHRFDTDNTPTALEPGVYYIVLVPPPTAIKPRFSLTTAATTEKATEFASSDYTIDKKGDSTIMLKPGMILDLGVWNSSGKVE